MSSNRFLVLLLVSTPRNQIWLPIWLIAGAMVLWGIVLAVGAFRAPVGIAGGQDFRKLVVVAATTAIFLLVWGLVLLVRTVKVRRQEKSREEWREEHGEWGNRGKDE